MACYWVTPATTTTTTTITTTNTTTTTTTTTAATTPTTTAQAQAGNQTPGDHSWYWDPNAPPWNAMLQLALQTPGEFVLHSLTLRASGTGDDALGVAAVDLAWDVNANGAYDNGTDVLLASGAYAADDGTLTLAPSPAAALPHGALLLIVYEMMSQAREEDTFTFQVTAVSIEDAETHATLPVSGLPVAGCMKTTVRGPTTATTTATTTAPGVIYIFGIPWWIWVAVLLLALVVLVLVALLWRQRRRQQEAGR